MPIPSVANSNNTLLLVGFRRVCVCVCVCVSAFVCVTCHLFFCDDDSFIHSLDSFLRCQLAALFDGSCQNKIFRSLSFVRIPT
jgi:hypothetical protein